jgi:hypothetical protein
MCGWENGKCVTDDAAPAGLASEPGPLPHPTAPDGATYVSSTLPAESPPEGQAHRLSYGQRIAVTISILHHRDASQATCDLAIRALQGFDVVAEAGR